MEVAITAPIGANVSRVADRQKMKVGRIAKFVAERLNDQQRAVLGALMA